MSAREANTPSDHDKIGWTVFDNLYLLNSTLYVVSDEPESMPDIEFVLSKGLDIENGKAAEDSRLPTAKELSIVSSKQAASMFQGHVQTLAGTSVSSSAASVHSTMA